MEIFPIFLYIAKNCLANYKKIAGFYLQKNIFIIYYILQLAAKYNVLLRVESQYTDKTLLKSPYLFHLFIRKNWSSIFIPFNLHQMCMTIWIIQWISYNFCFCSGMIYHDIISIFILSKGIMSRTVNTF